jgi:hypothetical protein
MTATTATTFENSFLYEECSIPVGMTLTEWRRESHGPQPARPGVVRGLLNRFLP